MTSKLADVGVKFKGRYKLQSGGEFFGQLLIVPSAVRMAHYLYIARLLRTGVNTPVRPGSVITCDNTMYIVAEHGESTYVNPLCIQFKLFEVTDQLEWKSKTSQTDTLTGVQKPSRTTSNGIVFVYIQPSPNLTDTLGVGQVTKQAVVNKHVLVDDMVGPYIVTKSDQSFGITTLELRLP